MDIAAGIRDAGQRVVTGRPGIGRTTGVTEIETRITGTGRVHDGTDDINGIVTDNRAVAYIRRDGTVWLLADGPVNNMPNAIVFIAAHRDDDITDFQIDALGVVQAVLGAAYGLDTPDSDQPEGEK